MGPNTPTAAALLVGLAFLTRASLSVGADLADAEAMYRAGDYAHAEALFRRHLVQFPQEDVARLRAGQSALALGRYLDAAGDFELVLRVDGELGERARFLAGLASYRLGDFVTASSQWGDTVRLVRSADVASAAQYGRAWCAIRRHKWSDASAELRRLLLLFPASAESERTSLLTNALRNADALPTRSPGAAKWLSTVVPGAGQMYAGRVGSGMVSLGINASFFYLLGRAVRDGRWVDALFIYAGGGRFYWGGRQNAESFALARNERVRDGFVTHLARYEF